MQNSGYSCEHSYLPRDRKLEGRLKSQKRQHERSFEKRPKVTTVRKTSGTCILHLYPFDHTMEYFTDAGICVMDWPARIPDLNPIENIWAQLAWDVYKEFRQFEYEDDLHEAITAAWDRINESALRAVIASMPDRLTEVLLKRGDPTHY
eukprot:IDg23158t1